MVPFLAPLLGSLAGTLLPASVGTGIAASLGLSGAAAGLAASAAPAAIGAGIGTLLSGGDLGEAAMNAVGFGAGGALLGGAGTAGAATASPATAGTMSNAANAAASNAAANAAASNAVANATTNATANAAPAAASGMNPMDVAKAFGQVQGMMGGGQPQQTPMPAPQPVQARPPRAQENPMLASIQGPSPALSTSMPASVGIGSIPMGGQAPMSSQNMFAGMGPDQQRMVGDYLRSQGMVGFA